MKKLLILLSAFLLCFSLSAQWTDFAYESDVDTPESSWSIIRTAFDSTGRLYLSNSTGKVWYTDNPFDASPTYTVLMDVTLSNGIQGIAIDAADNVYVSGDNSPDGYIARFDSSGTEVWSYVLAGKRVTSCAILSSGELLVTSFGGLFYVFDADDPMKYEILDEFDATDPGWGAPVLKDATGNPSANTDFTVERNVDLALEGIEVPAESNGKALKLGVNEEEPGQNNSVVVTDIGEATWSNYSVTWNQLVTFGGTTGTTEFHGVGVRSEGVRNNGYFVEIRTDESASFGDYFNFIKYVDGVPTTITRAYFFVGTGGKAFGDSPEINLNPDPDGDPIGATDIWVTYKIEAVGSVINLYVNDLATPIYTYDDPDPILTGKVSIFADDPWSSVAGEYVNSYIDELKIEGPKVQTPGLANFVRDIAITSADDIFAIQSGAVKKVTGGALGQFSAAAFGDAAYLDMSHNVRPTVAYDEDLNAVFSSNFDIGPPVTAGTVFIQDADSGSILQIINDFPYSDFQATSVAVTDVGAAKALLVSGFRDVMRLYQQEEIDVSDWQLYGY